MSMRCGKHCIKPLNPPLDDVNQSRNSNLLDNQLIGLPDATGDPQATVDKLNITVIRSCNGTEHTEAVLARVNILAVTWAEERIEDVAWTRERATGTHIETVDE